MRSIEIIEKIYSGLYERASSPDYSFEKFKGSWGYKSTDAFQDKLLDFISEIRRLAKESPVLHGQGGYYLFDGRIYVSIGEDLIEAAYDRLVERLRIVPVIGNRTLCRKYFIGTIYYADAFCPRAEVQAFSNGVLDMTGLYSGGGGNYARPVFHEGFSPEYHVTYMHPYEYNASAKCNKWQSFLHEVLPDKNLRLIIQMFLGLGLIERSNAYNPYEGKKSVKVELCLVLLGNGSNGKSTVYDVAKGIFGNERISGVDYDELTAMGDEGMRARRLLRNAIFNWSSDSDARTFGRKRTGVFKRIVSGESVTDRAIGENVRENCNIPFLVFNLNELPYPDDQSLGFIRRLQIVPFEVVIPKNRQNPSLSSELLAERSGIFNWIVRGARELKRKKFAFPSSEGCRRQVIKAQLQTNPVLAWVNSYQMRWDMRAKNETGMWIPTKILLQSLERFCEDNDVPMVSKQKFGQTMSRIGGGFFKKRIAGAFNYEVYGCTEAHLSEPFVIDNEEMTVNFVKEDGSFISDDD